MNFKITPEIHFGIGILKEFKIPKHDLISIVVSRSLAENSYLDDTVLNYLRSNAIDFEVTIAESGEPESDVLDNLNQRVNSKCCAIIGIGGGSILDSVKFISAFRKSNRKAHEYDFGKTDIDEALPIYLIPTTCGSGSEVTPYAVATNSKSRRKYTITSDCLYPKSCWVDPELLRLLPQDVLINSALDAFVHCFEAYTNHKRNIFIDHYALSGMKVIYNELQNLSNFPKIEQIRNLCYASLCGGICITHNRTGMIHTLSVALSEYSKEPHGLLNAKIFGEILSYNLKAYKGDLRLIATHISNKAIESDMEAYHLIMDYIRGIIKYNRVDFQNEPVTDHVVSRVQQDKGLADISPRNFNENDLANITKAIVCQDWTKKDEDLTI